MPAALMVVGILFSPMCLQVEDSELECEEAVSHLRECCPGFVGDHKSCVADKGCGVSPNLDIATSQCIESRDCAALVAQGVCERAQKAQAGDAGDTPGVCP